MSAPDLASTSLPMKPSPSGVSRRTALAGAAWSAPVIVVAAAAPAFATSGTSTLTARDPGGAAFDEDTLAARSVTAALRNGTDPVDSAAVTYTLSGQADWLSLPGGANTAVATTDSSGIATTALSAVAGTTPTPGDEAILTATHQSLAVTWTITYRPYRLLATNAQFTVAVTGGSRAVAWGTNVGGQLGDTTFTRRTRPVAVATVGTPMHGKSIAAIAPGRNHCVALTEDGSVYAWGRGNQLGNGNGVGQDEPAPVAVTTVGTPMEGMFITAISASGHSLARASDGTVYAWGDGGSGQLGNGSAFPESTPVAVDIEGVATIAAGREHSLALAADGTVYAWGRNVSGQLGNGDRVDRHTPVPVTTTGTAMEGRTITAISAGDAHCLALASDGTVYAWGENSAGQLGVGDEVRRLTPVAVTTAGTPMEDKFIVAVVAGASHSLVLDSDGGLYAWGFGNSGRLGNGDDVNRSTPVPVTITGTPMEGKSVVAIDASHHSLALASDGTAYAWGPGSEGQLGNDSTDSQPLPVMVISEPTA